MGEVVGERRALDGDWGDMVNGMGEGTPASSAGP